MKIEVHVNRLSPDAAADILCRKLEENDDKAAREIAGENWVGRGSPLQYHDINRVLTVLLEEETEHLSEESEQYLKEFQKAY